MENIHLYIAYLKKKKVGVFLQVTIVVKMKKNRFYMVGKCYHFFYPINILSTFIFQALGYIYEQWSDKIPAFTELTSGGDINKKDNYEF